MQEPEQNAQNDFMIEKIKERPINKRRLIRRTLITASMAVIFGLTACVTFLMLEPVINNRLYPEEEAPPVQPIEFPEDPEEMSPEEMLADNISPEEEAEAGEPENIVLEEEQIQEILSGVVLNRENYGQIYSALSEYTNELNHAMVTVTGVNSNVDWFNNVEESEKQSSGLILAENGKELLILVDYTPLRGTESMSMTFSFLRSTPGSSSDYRVPVTLKALDVTTNFAVLSAELEDIPAEIKEDGGLAMAELGSSNTRNIVGAPVIALGSPMGISDSMGYGMITAMAGQYQYADTNYKWMQTDIFGSRNAGGVLFNLQGQVIGVITSQKISDETQNVVCAYGISELKKRIEKMSNGLPLSYLGVTGMDVPADVHVQMGVPYGAYVQNVDMDSPVMLAGIQKGDVLVAFGEHTLLSYNDYISSLMQAEVGSSVELTVMRAAQGEYREMTFEVVIGER